MKPIFSTIVVVPAAGTESPNGQEFGELGGLDGQTFKRRDLRPEWFIADEAELFRGDALLTVANGFPCRRDHPFGELVRVRSGNFAVVAEGEEPMAVAVAVLARWQAS